MGGDVAKVEVLGVSFDRITMDDLLATLVTRISENERTTIAFSNPEFVIEASKNQALRKYLNDCDYNLADGWGIIWGARVIGLPEIPERITGTDFVPRICESAAANDLSVYFFGAKPGVAEQAAENMQEQFPSLRIAGAQHGYVTDQAALVAAINMADPDILMVCLGNPRQEEWIETNREQLNSRLIFGNGGALDFHSGSVRRAPEAWIRLHIEWLYRLFQNPSWQRLRRQLRLGIFVARILAVRLRRTLGGAASPDRVR